MTKTNNTLKWRVGQLEKSVDSMDNRIDNLMENHIPHINQSITKLKGKIDKLSTRITLGITINILMVAATILGIVLLVK